MGFCIVWQVMKFFNPPPPSYCDCVPDKGSAMSAVVSFQGSPVCIVGNTVVSLDWKVLHCLLISSPI